MLTLIQHTAAIKPRQLLGQLGSIQCNIARVRIVGALGDAGDAISNIQDPATSAAASAGLDQANGGISQIASAIVAGEAPPAEGRSEVEAGLKAMGTALTAGDRYVSLKALGNLSRPIFNLLTPHDSTDAAVGDAQSALADATAAGQDVVAQC